MNAFKREQVLIEGHFYTTNTLCCELSVGSKSNFRFLLEDEIDPMLELWPSSPVRCPAP